MQCNGEKKEKIEGGIISTPPLDFIATSHTKEEETFEED